MPSSRAATAGCVNEWWCPQYLEDRRDDIDAARSRAPADHRRRPPPRPADRVPARPAGAPAPASGVGAILGVSNGLYTIPSLALFPLLVPFTGITATTVVIGLALYALTILVRGILDGLRSVPDDVVESAVGLGYGPTRLLLGAAAARAAGDDGGAAGGDRVDGRAHHRRHPGVVRRPRRPDLATGCSNNFRAELRRGRVLCVVLALLLDVVLVVAQRMMTPWTRRGGADEHLRADVGLPHRPPRNWTGAGGLLDRLVEQLLLTVTALLLGVADRAAARALARAHRPRRLPGDQHLQHRPRGPDLRPARSPGHRRLARPRPVRSLRSRRPRHADRPRPVRPAAAGDQRVHRGPRGAGRRARGGRRDGHVGCPAVLAGRAAAGTAVDDVRRAAGAGPGLGDGDHRRAGRGAGRRGDHRRRDSPATTTARASAQRSWWRSRRCCSR